MTPEQSPNTLCRGPDLWAAGSHQWGGGLFTQYIPAGNCQSRWWGCPRETVWVYQRAAASENMDTASKLPSGGMPSRWSWKKAGSRSSDPARPGAASPGQGLREWPWKVPLIATAGGYNLWPQQQLLGSRDFQGAIKLIRHIKDPKEAATWREPSLIPQGA